MEAQPLLTRRPIVCTRCMHGHAVDVITGRENTPTEYHCAFCGNYAIVGVNAQFPFMEVVKGPKPEIKNIEVSKNIKSRHDDSGSSPMQVGESLVKSAAPRARQFTKPAQRAVITENKTAKKCQPEKEGKPMAKPTCQREGCKNTSAAVWLCEDHFREQYGITVTEYRDNKLHRTESASTVAARLKGEKPMSKKVSNPSPEEAGATRPAPPPAPPKPATSGTVMAQPNCPLFHIFLDPELLDALTAAAKAEYRTPELHAAYLIDRAVRGA